MQTKDSKIGACINIFLKAKLFFYYYQNFTSSTDSDEQIYLDNSESALHIRKGFLWLMILELYKIIAHERYHKSSLRVVIKELRSNNPKQENISKEHLEDIFERNRVIIKTIDRLRNKLIAHSDPIDSSTFLFTSDDIIATRELIIEIERALILINNNTSNTQEIDKIALPLKKFNLIKHAAKGKKHS